MIGLDTNVVIRYFVQDDAAQSARAIALIDGLTERSPAFVSVVTMAELAWVLKRSFRLSGPELVSIVESILATETFAVENERQVFEAMIDLKEGRASFPDALIVALGRKAGCAATYTFDRRASRLRNCKAL